jgi:ribose transport system substrate-binding protein
MSGSMRIAVFTKNRTNPAYAAARTGADRAARLFGAQLVHYVPAQADDPVEQVALIDRALTQAPDAIVLSPVHASLVDPAIRRIAKAGIPIVSFVSAVTAAPCVSHIGSDDRRLAFEIGQYLFRHLGGHGNVLVVTGHGHAVTSLARVRGFELAAQQHPGIAFVGRCIGNYDRETARTEVGQWLAAHPQQALDACLAANDIMALGVLDALDAASRPAAVVGVNAIPEAVEAIGAGRMLATADFNAMQMAFLATECAVRHLRGQKAPPSIELPVQIVDRANCRLWDRPYEERPTLSLDQLKG